LVKKGGFERVEKIEGKIKAVLAKIKPLVAEMNSPSARAALASIDTMANATGREFRPNDTLTLIMAASPTN
jgi:hypothetical protein